MTSFHFSTKRMGRRFLLLAVVLELLVAATPLVQAQTLTTLYSFTGGADGYGPLGTLIKDKAGNLYGTATYGGIQNPNCFQASCGTAFELTPSGGVWSFSLLHSFQGYPDDGANPSSGLAIDKEGNLYGTTGYGGIPWCQFGATGCGSVFKLTPSKNGWMESVLYYFPGNGHYGPVTGVVLDKEGNLYGAADDGALGEVYEVTTSGTEKELYGFTGGADGYGPAGDLIFDKKGNLYDTTAYGGEGQDCYLGCGTVFKLAPDGTETVLYSFTGGMDGYWPLAGLVLDRKGNLYGTTFSGGGGSGCSGGCGTVFKLAPDGTETVLHRFDGSDGANPRGGLVFDAKGNLYGTTTVGGAHDGGMVFKLTPSGGNWTETVLHSFEWSDGAAPYGSLLLKGGILYGTTSWGGANNWGTVFALNPEKSKK